MPFTSGDSVTPMTHTLVPVNPPPKHDLQTAGPAVPLVLAQAGLDAVREFLNFFAGTIHNPQTRRAYLKAVGRFFGWLADRQLPLKQVEPAHVGAYLAWLGRQPAARGGTISVPTVKQALAAIRTLFDHLVVTHVLRLNPATSVRGPRHVVEVGKTPVLDADEARQLLDGIDTSHVVGLRDRALVAVMVYSFARVGAAVGLDVGDYAPQGKRWFLTLHEKRGRVNRMPCHHTLVEYLDAYVEAAGIGGELKGPLFRAAVGRTRTLTAGRLSAKDAHALVPPAGEGLRHLGADRLPHLPGDGDYGLPEQRWDAGEGPADGRACQQQDHQAVRPAAGLGDARRSGADSDLRRLQFFPAPESDNHGTLG